MQNKGLWKCLCIYTCHPLFFSPGGICYVLWHLGTVPRVVWCVGLSLCLSASDFMFIASISVFMIWRSLTLPVYLVICHISPPPSPSVFLFSLLLSYAAVNLNTHLSLEVVKQKCVCLSSSAFYLFFHLLCMAGREWHCNYEICPLKPSPESHASTACYIAV